MINGKAFLAFGSGDIQTIVCPIEVEGKEKIALLSKTMPPQEARVPMRIGRLDNLEWDPADAEVVMAFPSVEYAKEVLATFRTMIEEYETLISETALRLLTEEKEKGETQC